MEILPFIVQNLVRPRSIFSDTMVPELLPWATKVIKLPFWVAARETKYAKVLNK